jgi:hypothetical protein
VEIDPSTARGIRALGVAIALGPAFCALSSADARAADAVTRQTWDSGEVDEHVEDEGDRMTASGVAGVASSMAGNPDLDGSAWAHTGAFWSVHLHHGHEARIRVDAADAAEFAPGLSVWAIGPAAPFDGGTTSWEDETSSAAFGTPHSFNAFGPLGDAGTLWMQEGEGGNAKELLGYALSGPSFLDPTGWGESIEHGAHDVRLTDDYAAGVSGSVGAGFAELVLAEPALGWYLIYVGGTDHSLAGGQFDLSVELVPEPAPVWMGTGATGALLALAARGTRARRR